MILTVVIINTIIVITGIKQKKWYKNDHTEYKITIGDISEIQS